jgi:hypothetical protein
MNLRVLSLSIPLLLPHDLAAGTAGNMLEETHVP